MSPNITFYTAFTYNMITIILRRYKDIEIIQESTDDYRCDYHNRSSFDKCLSIFLALLASKVCVYIEMWYDVFQLRIVIVTTLLTKLFLVFEY